MCGGMQTRMPDALFHKVRISVSCTKKHNTPAVGTSCTKPIPQRKCRGSIHLFKDGWNVSPPIAMGKILQILKSSAGETNLFCDLLFDNLTFYFTFFRLRLLRILFHRAQAIFLFRDKKILLFCIFHVIIEKILLSFMDA